MKLIFFDIDGTLIDEKHNAPESMARAIRKAQANGHLCLVNTGRTSSIVMNWLPELAPFDGYLCGCGTNVIFHGEDLMHRTFTEEESMVIIEGLEKYRIDAILEGGERDYCKELDKMHTETFSSYMREHSLCSHCGTYEEAVGRFDKFYCYCDTPGNVENMVRECGELLDLIDRENGFYEVVPKGYSKATAMDFMVEYLNRIRPGEPEITIEDTIAIGDSNNDLPMLLHAGIAVAMGKSSPKVYEVADLITDKVMEDGIYRALEKLGVL